MNTVEQFTEYRELYNSYLARIVQWSESEFLTPQYLHLHEDDIGQAGDYRMFNHLASFVASLGFLTSKIARIVFCHSWESSSPASPEECKKGQFFYYAIEGSPPHDVSANVFVGPGGEDGTRRPAPVSIEQLNQVLGKSQLIQPYILLHQNGKVICESTPCEASKENIQRLVGRFQEEGAYQFSIYGYSLIDGYLPPDTMTFLIRQAFVNHIVSWNHDLRGAHRLRRYLVERLNKEKVFEKWTEGQGAVNELLNTVKLLGSATKSSRLITVVPVDKEIVINVGHPNAIFKKNMFHDIADIDFERFIQWYSLVKRAATNGNPDLHVFVEYCGASECIANPESIDTTLQLIWARSIWLATKLLTNRLLRGRDRATQYRGVWVDQVALSILLGLSRVQRTRIIPFSITYRLLEDAVLPTAQGKMLDDFLAYCNISNQEENRDLFYPGGWKIRQSDQRIEACWSMPPISSMRDALKTFVMAGLLRTDDAPRSPNGRANMLCVYDKYEDADVQARCLAELSNLSEELSRQDIFGPEEKVIMSEAKIDFEVDPWHGKYGRSRMTATFGCEGSFRKDFVTHPPGQFLSPFRELMNCFGQSRFYARTAQRPGVRICDNRPNKVSVYVVLNSWDETWPE